MSCEFWPHMEIDTCVCIIYVHQHTTRVGAKGVQDALVCAIYADKHV